MGQIKKTNHTRVLAAYYQGVRDRLERRSPKPPKPNPARKAYINGFHNAG